jgi:hypothetical protein
MTQQAAQNQKTQARVESEEFLPGLGWTIMRRGASSEGDAFKIANRLKRCKDCRNLCVVVRHPEDVKDSRYTLKSRFGHAWKPAGGR